ncbi:leukotriene A-4 hydrolase [Coniosporium apollinis CBS 100218]|uniref:Leukotriene A(4) hydrolase n=1 Tax=Coniosporium apollinis (strain CBS 100218) TaxID=1168221 RepID=R7Z2U9_CONA1|nr:leukotriene A-4 hydrolase [Coniosporium apollinis CBS 100218]EON68246.1 leukotriene A-4 hydrolase [Coniosporium apollinis CBS 100218]
MHRAPHAMVTHPPPQDITINVPRDPNTLSNYNNFVTKHTIANFEINFEKRVLEGNVELSLESITEGEIDRIVLDTSHLDIKEVKIGGKTAKWGLASRFEPYGSPLTVTLDGGVAKGKCVQLDITLSTTEKCTALQWLTPAQTSNKKHPYMFSQCQAIHARSIFPCQDTPDVKSTFAFNLRSPLPVLASGLPTGANNWKPGKDGKSGTLLYTFKQDVPIPSYLFAIASGDLASASIGPRSTVWTGPEEIQSCKWELENDMEKFLEAAEKIVYDYAWTTYNVLVLPASFPYGGMENPVYTFATPTIISGDRQNVDVIAHELSHSWSGNLISNASWEHFWLNEGWTTYLERRIQAAIHGEPHRDFSAIIGWKALQDSVERFGEDHEFTKLIVDLKGKDPDDAFSSVPYEKGFIFLYYLEKLIGKEKWDKFIPHYFTSYKFKSLDSYDFKATLLDFFSSDSEASKKLEDLDWDTWFYKAGYPPKPDFDTSMVDVCYKLADNWEAFSKGSDSAFNPNASDIEGWSANQCVVFLERVQSFSQALKPGRVDLMGEKYGFAKSKNVELVSRYFVIGLKARAQSVYQPTAELLGKVGRMKFVRPLFKGLDEADRTLAVDTFEKNKDFYHPICRAMVEKDLFGDR